MRVRFKIQRYNPETDAKPHVEEYGLDVGRGATVLDGLIRLKNEQEGSLTFRHSCRSAICGSCSMEINGSEKLACRTQVRRELERYGEIDVAPLNLMAPIKDLVVDMKPFWEKIRQINPWIEALPHEKVDPISMRDAHQSFNNVDACIMCGACLAACTVYEVDKGFIGPAALAKAYRIVGDPRESEVSQRLESYQGPGGIWDCTRCNFCVEVCPKDVNPMEAIVRLRRTSIEKGLVHTMGSSHITSFVEIVKKEGRLNEALMPLMVVRKGGFRNILRIIPLGIRMFLKGKAPFPIKFSPAIPGMKQIRSIFASSEKR